jgi:hypothetical protein
MPDTLDWLGQPPAAVADAIATVHQACAAWPKAPIGASLANHPIGLEAIVCRIVLESADTGTIGELHEAIMLTVAAVRPFAAAGAGAATLVAAAVVIFSLVARVVRRHRRAALVQGYEARIAGLEAENLALIRRLDQPAGSAA